VESSIALVTRSTSNGGVAWSYLLGADGCSGWTSAALGSAAELRLKLISADLHLLAKSPDEVSPEAAGEVTVSAADQGIVLGNSLRAVASSRESARIPERLRADHWTWLNVKFGSASGYVPLNDVELNWTGGEDLGQVKGWVRRPFLGPYLKDLAQLGPLVNTKVKVWDENTGRLVEESLDKDWVQAESFYRDPVDSSRTLIVYASGKDRLFRIAKGNSVTALMLNRGDRLNPRRMQFLNPSGSWLIESTGIYGDGTYSSLLKLDLLNGTMLERRLSSSSGAKDQEADWWVQDQKVWIASRNDEQAWLEGIGVTEGKGGWIVSVSGEADYERVRRNALLKNAGVIPGRLNPLRWDLAVAFETEAVARQAAGSWVGSDVAYWPSSEAAVVKKK